MYSCEIGADVRQVSLYDKNLCDTWRVVAILEDGLAFRVMSYTESGSIKVLLDCETHSADVSVISL